MLFVTYSFQKHNLIPNNSKKDYKFIIILVSISSNLKNQYGSISLYVMYFFFWTVSFTV